MQSINLELARYDFELPPTLEDEEIEVVLAKADALAAWVSDVKDYALQAAVSGKQWTGWKLVEGRSNRKYTDETAVAEAVTKAGYNPYEQKLLGITAMTSVLGKKQFEASLEALLTSPRVNQRLCRRVTKRPVMNTANQDFKDEN